MAEMPKEIRLKVKVDIENDGNVGMTIFTGNSEFDISDGHHTFGELYLYRMLYNAMLFNEWAKRNLYGVCKSKRHHDGEECFGGGWFIVCAELPTGQISNHYKIEYWDLFRVPEMNRAPVYDGHTPAQAAERMMEFLKHPGVKG